MTNRTWIGGGNNRADNPKDWSPTGVPQAGDVVNNGDLLMASGTMNLSNFDLNGNLLAIEGNVAINLSHDASLTVFAEGTHATFGVQGDDHLSVFLGELAGPNDIATVNLAANSHWIGGFSVFNGASLVVNDAPHASFITSSSGTSGQNAHAVIEPDVAGSGNVVAIEGSTLEFGRSVASTLDVGVGSTHLFGSSNSLLQIDRPSLFAAHATLQGGGEIDLMGLATADSYTFQNDLLSILGSGKVIDTLRLTDSTPNSFEVEKAAGSVNVLAYTDASHTVVGTALPLHA